MQQSLMPRTSPSIAFYGWSLNLRYFQVEEEGEVATAFTLARMLSDIPLTRGGPASIVIFDIHALQVRQLIVY